MIGGTWETGRVKHLIQILVYGDAEWKDLLTSCIYLMIRYLNRMLAFGLPEAHQETMQKNLSACIREKSIAEAKFLKQTSLKMCKVRNGLFVAVTPMQSAKCWFRIDILELSSSKESRYSSMVNFGIMQILWRNMMPKVIVAYERIPYIYPGGNVRITFDKSISSSTQVLKFLDGDYQSRPILPVGNSILEVKWDEILPLHIKQVMQLNQLQWTAFSKYCLCRKYHL